MEIWNRPKCIVSQLNYVPDPSRVDSSSIFNIWKSDLGLGPMHRFRLQKRALPWFANVHRQLTPVQSFVEIYACILPAKGLDGNLVMFSRRLTLRVLEINSSKVGRDFVNNLFISEHFNLRRQDLTKFRNFVALPTPSPRWNEQFTLNGSDDSNELVTNNLLEEHIQLFSR